MDIKEFYKNFPPSLEEISSPNWRQFRFALPNGRFFKVPDTIRNEKILQKWLVKKNPADVYYSVAKFLSPQKVGAKTDELYKNLFLGADLVFDIDFSPFSIRKLEMARKEALKLLGFLRQKKIVVKYIAFSGAKGFHLVCIDPFEYNCESPVERENQAKKFRKEIAGQVLSDGIKIDSKVTVDTRRIIRLPGTINSKTGLECIVLHEEELQLRASKIIKKSGRVIINASAIRKEMTGKFHFLRKIFGLESIGSQIKPPYIYCSFLSSQVVGTKNHVPILIFTSLDKKKVVDAAKRIQEEYLLGDFFLFRAKKFFAVGLDCLQPRRIEKILKKAGSANFNFFKKHGRAFVQVSPVVDEKMMVTEKAPEFIALIQSPLVSRNPVSNSHLKFFQDCKIETMDYAKKAGESEYVLSHALVEN